jgi:hypothetical protein
MIVWRSGPPGHGAFSAYRRKRHDSALRGYCISDDFICLLRLNHSAPLWALHLTPIVHVFPFMQVGRCWDGRWVRPD